MTGLHWECACQATFGCCHVFAEDIWIEWVLTDERKTETCAVEIRGTPECRKASDDPHSTNSLRSQRTDSQRATGRDGAMFEQVVI